MHEIHHLLSRVITACVALLIFIIVIHYFLPPLLAWSGQNVICQTSELHSIVVGSHWILEGVTVSTSYIGGSLDPGLYSMPQEITHCRMTANVCVQLCIGPILCPTTLSMGSHA